MGISEWLLVWLILNALFFVWRILVTNEVEISAKHTPPGTKIVVPAPPVSNWAPEIPTHERLAKFHQPNDRPL